MRFAVPSAVTVDAVGSYPAHACAWTTPCRMPPFHPYRPRASALSRPCGQPPSHSRETLPPCGGKVGEAVSFCCTVCRLGPSCDGLLRPAVSRHPALCGPDFPPHAHACSDCLADFRGGFYRLALPGTGLFAGFDRRFGAFDEAGVLGKAELAAPVLEHADGRARILRRLLELLQLASFGIGDVPALALAQDPARLLGA